MRATMRVGICSVGSELVSGHISDTNAGWLARRVNESGCAVSAVLVVGDDRVQIVEALRWLADRCDVLVVGGGLGPTSDDLTRYAVAEFAGQDLERRHDLVQHLEQVYLRLARSMPPDALRQADVPAGAEVHAPQGTAAGFSLDVRRDTGAGLDDGADLRVHVLPGVPWEYQELADRFVLPDIVRGSGGSARVTRTLHVAGRGESAVGDVLLPISDRLDTARANAVDPEHGIEIGYLATDDEVLVRISGTGPDPRSARRRLEPVVDQAAALLGAAVTSIDERRLEDEVALLLDRLGATVATAETFTGGRIASALSSPAGSAGRLRGGFVAGTPAALLELLGADAAVLGDDGPVSAPVAAALAGQARRRCGADWAVAAVAVFDPEQASGEQPVGSAVWAVAGPDDVLHVEERFIPAADRAVLQARSAAFALESLRHQLLVRSDCAPDGVSEPAPTVTP